MARRRQKSQRQRQPRKSPNVILLAYDCLRLDYWQKQMRLSTPHTTDWFHLDNHWAVAHCSDPNYSTILGGQPPWVTGITTQMGTEYKALAPSLLPLRLQKHGYYTCAIQPVYVPRFYHQFEQIAWHKTESVADLELRALRAFVDEKGDRPLFLFIRDMTCHYPYFNRPSPPRGSGGDIIPQYAEAVDHCDKHLAALVDYVENELPDTIIVVCADHGELLGEHGEWDHLYTLYNYLVRVPCAIRIPGKRGKRTDAPTQHTDLWPTLCDLTGLENGDNAHINGTNLAPWLRGKQKKLPKDRLLWLQGIGAGRLIEEDGQTSIDPGLQRVLWRHRAAVWGKQKLVENIHADGDRTLKAYRADDYAEARPLTRVNMNKGDLPPVPQYHDWEEEFLDLRREANQDILMDRLKALGYA